MKTNRIRIWEIGTFAVLGVILLACVLWEIPQRHQTFTAQYEHTCRGQVLAPGELHYQIHYVVEVVLVSLIVGMVKFTIGGILLFIVVTVCAVVYFRSKNTFPPNMPSGS